MWKEEIYNLLKINQIDFEYINEQSVFELIFIPKHQIYLHLIDLKTFQENNLPNNYFLQYSDTINAKNQRVIHLWEDVYLSKTELVKSRILAMLGIFTRLHARHCFIERIDKSTVHNFLEINHLQGFVKAKFKYGLFLKPQYVERFVGTVVCGDTDNGSGFGVVVCGDTDNGNAQITMPKLIAVATFSGGRTMKVGERTGKRSYELIRFASLKGFVVVGGMDKLLKTFIKEHNPDDIMSYADRDWSDGRSYDKLGFIKTENSTPQLFYINPKTFERKSNDDINCVRVFNSGSIKFIKTTKKSSVEATEDFVIENFKE
ncbi:MAG: hypothetical protein RLZZ306_1108 [Bacteroidota bacterium]